MSLPNTNPEILIWLIYEEQRMTVTEVQGAGDEDKLLDCLSLSLFSPSSLRSFFSHVLSLCLLFSLMVIFSLFPATSIFSPLPPYHHLFLFSPPSPSSSSYASSSSFDDAVFTADRRGVKVGLIVPSAHSNPNLLKTNGKSRYGVSMYDYDDEEIVQDSIVVNGVVHDDEDDDDDGIAWLEDEEAEFAEPANLNRGQQRSKLLAATQLRSGIQRKPMNVCAKADGKGKLGGNKGTKKKYSPLAEEFRLDNRWIPLLDYLSTFGMKESDLVRMYKRRSNVFCVNAYSAQERLEYLLDVGVKHKDIKKILVRQPQIIQYTVDNNLNHVAFLADLGIPASKIGKVITAAPSILSYSVENSLKPTVRYLIEEVGIKESDLAKVVALSPQILVQRIDISFFDRYDFLAEELGASKESIVKMVRKHPQLLHYSIEDGLLPRINFLRSIGMDNSDILKVLTSITQVLSLSLEENLKPKYLYLVNKLDNDVRSLTKYPAYLSLSLDQRIRPRHRYLVSLNKAPEGPFPLSSLFPNDKSFCQQWAGSSVDKYLAFRQSLMLEDFAKKYEKRG